MTNFKTRLKQYMVSDIARYNLAIHHILSKKSLMPSEVLDLEYLQDQVFMLEEDLLEVKED